MAGLGCLQEDQHRQIRATFPIRWILVPRASYAKLMQRSLHMGAVWCEVPAPPKDRDTPNPEQVNLEDCHNLRLGATAPGHGGMLLASALLMYL